MSELVAAISACPHCGGERLWRNGHVANGKQLYKCRACGRQFVQDPTQRPYRPGHKRDGSLTPYQSEVLQLIQSDPTLTLQNIADKVGITREGVRQASIRLKERGLLADRVELKKEVATRDRRLRVMTRERRKTIWLRMMFVAHRTRLRSLAHIDYTGMVRGYHMPGEETMCLFDGCTRPVDARGFCSLHYFHLRRTGALWVRRQSRSICDAEGCDLPVYARNMCYRHYAKWNRKNPVGRNLQSNNTSGYRGVSKASGTKDRWQAFISLPGKRQLNLGSYSTREMAARAYDTAARKHLGERAKLNFPNENIEVTKESVEGEQGRRIGVSGHQYVSWHAYSNRWVVEITRDGKRVYIGKFIDLDAAVQARDKALSP